MIQQSFQNDKASLYIVPTPIGNLKEMTPRAIEVLNEVDIIACEDTRTFGKLKQHFGITTPLTSYHMHNEKLSSEHLCNLLEEGKDVALVSDAGYPLISDPGQTLVFDVVQKGYNVIPISGSSAFLNALVASGLVVQPFAFIGFLESKEAALIKQLEKYKDIDMTTIYYVSVHKLETTIDTMIEILGDRDVCLAKEITKQFETFIRGKLSDIKNELEVIKGEFVLVVGAKDEEEVSIETLIRKVNEYKEQGLTTSKAINKVAKENDYSKNELYEWVHKGEYDENI